MTDKAAARLKEMLEELHYRRLVQTEIAERRRNALFVRIATDILPAQGTKAILDDVKAASASERV